MITFQHSAAKGITAACAPEVSIPRSDRTRTVFIPDGTHTEPGGAIVIVHQDTGELRLFQTL
jgi:hypothetical protein